MILIKTIPSSLMDDGSIEVFEEDFNNQTDGDSYGTSLNSCLIDYPSKIEEHPLFWNSTRTLKE